MARKHKNTMEGNSAEPEPTRLQLDGSRAIREWIDAHPAASAEVRLDEGFTLDFELVEPPGEKSLFGVQHFFYKPDGYPLFLFARVYESVNHEHALHQYLYSEANERPYGRGTEHVFVKLYDLPDFSYEGQEIRVFPLWEGTDEFI